MRPLRPGQIEVYSHRFSDGTARLFAISPLLADLPKLPGIVGTITGLDFGYAADMIRRGVVSRDRLRSITEDELRVPVLCADLEQPAEVEGTEVLLIDGHHRYVRLAQLGVSFIAAFIVPRTVWEGYLLENIVGIDATEIAEGILGT